MQIHTKHPRELTDEERRAWCGLLARYHQFHSPFFHPDYACELGAVRDQMEVAVLLDSHSPVGFLPFERHRHRVGQPPGVKLCDFQGVVAAPETQWTAGELLSGADLSVLHFDHLQNGQSPLAAFGLRSDLSPYLDLTEGYEAYLAERKRAGSGLISQTLRKRRKLERELGQVEFRWHEPEDEAWELLLQWKSAQRLRTQTFNILDLDWARQFLNRLRQRQTGSLQGALSTLRVDGKLLAVHFGIHTAQTLHYWFPSYDSAYSRYSPGLIILLELAQHCSQRQISRIDLGKGDDGYKYSFASGSDTVLTGAADLRPVRKAVRTAAYGVRRWIRQSPFYETVKLPVRMLRKLHHRLALS